MKGEGKGEEPTTSISEGSVQDTSKDHPPSTSDQGHDVTTVHTEQEPSPEVLLSPVPEIRVEASTQPEGQHGEDSVKVYTYSESCTIYNHDCTPTLAVVAPCIGLRIN